MPDNAKATSTPARGHRDELARRIVAELVHVRRRSAGESSSADAIAAAVQQPRVRVYVDRDAPIEMLLPAFPAKSPNRARVLGALPDLAECVSLRHLDAMCARIGAFYPPGARLAVCADGHVFADLIRVHDTDVGRYQSAIAELIRTQGLRHLTLFNLDDLADYRALAPDYDAMRAKLSDAFGEPLDVLRSRLLGTPEHLALYRGVTRFMFEDGMTPGYTGSRTALQRDAKTRALSVIQRSWAWGRRLVERDPDAIRLSIHPQAPGSLKLGIHMMPTGDAWLTPWHGVALQDGHAITLVKRADALAMGATLAYVDGVPSHYVRGST